MSPPSGGGKRGRDPEEDVYVDNLHSHKRYLSEVSLSLPLPMGHGSARPLRPGNFRGSVFLGGGRRGSDSGRFRFLVNLGVGREREDFLRCSVDLCGLFLLCDYWN